MLSSLYKHGARQSSFQRVVSRGFAKEIKFGVEGRAAMLIGVNTLADAVQVRIEERSTDESRMKIEKSVLQTT